MSDDNDNDEQDNASPESREVIIQMDYMRPFKFVFSNPSWFSSAIMAGLCMLIPVIGGIVVGGYLFLVVEHFYRNKSDTPYPEFDFGLFSDYLSRGIWVLLMQLIFSAMVVGVIIVFEFALLATIIGGISIFGEESGAVLIFALLVFYAMFFLLIIGIQIVSLPFMLRAGLSQNLKIALDIQWSKDFLSTMWKEILLSFLVILIGGTIIALIGYAAFCIGIIPAFIIISLAEHHLTWQIYEIYLSRGGQPIPMKRKQVYEDEFE